MADYAPQPEPLMTLTDDEKAAIRALQGVLDSYDEPETCEYRTVLDQCGLPEHAYDICTEHGGCARPCDVEVLVGGLRVLTAALRDPDEATVKAVERKIRNRLLIRPMPGDLARAAIAALADHLLGGEEE